MWIVSSGTYNQYLELPLNCLNHRHGDMSLLRRDVTPKVSLHQRVIRNKAYGSLWWRVIPKGHCSIVMVMVRVMVRVRNDHHSQFGTITLRNNGTYSEPSETWSFQIKVEIILAQSALIFYRTLCSVIHFRLLTDMHTRCLSTAKSQTTSNLPQISTDCHEDFSAN